MRDLMNIVESAGGGYKRVIPRDLFNEANLMKCYGQLYLELERLQIPGVDLVHDDRAFVITQDGSSGETTIANVRLMVRGEQCPLSRPLNTREPWSLYALVNDDELEVFNSSGRLSDEMLAYLRGDEE